MNNRKLSMCCEKAFRFNLVPWRCGAFSAFKFYENGNNCSTWNTCSWEGQLERTRNWKALSWKVWSWKVSLKLERAKRNWKEPIEVGKNRAKLERIERNWKASFEVGKFRRSWKVLAEVGKFEWTWKVVTDVGKFIISSKLGLGKLTNLA